MKPFYYFFFKFNNLFKMRNNTIRLFISLTYVGTTQKIFVLYQTP